MHYSSLLYKVIQNELNAIAPDIMVTDAHWKDGVNTGVIMCHGEAHILEIRPVESQVVVGEWMYPFWQN